MPKPPILSTLDWRSIHASGTDYATWIERAENRENADRMEANRKRVSLEPAVSGALVALDRPVYVVAIAEDWCGDVVRHAPVLAALAQSSRNVFVRFITREQHPEVFVRFLTNGGEAIPKFVFLNDQFVECGNWGPMPAICREVIARGKACGQGGPAREKVSALYEADKNRRLTICELMQLIEIASSRDV